MIKKSSTSKNYLKIPTFAVIAAVLLFMASSSAATYFYLQTKTPTTTPAQTATTASATFEAKQSDRPELKFFVMSFCPYGNQMEDALYPVAKLLGTKANIRPQYIFNKISDIATYCKGSSGDPAQCATYVQNKYFTNETECKKTIADNLKRCQDESQYIKSKDGGFYSSLHGRQEANQNLREICAWNQLGDDKANWWKFVENSNKNCTAQNADTCWEQQAKDAGLDSAKISECFNKDGIALIEKEIAETSKYNVSGSPTLIVNEVAFPPETGYTQDNKGATKLQNNVIITQDKYRSPNGLKEMVCSLFKNAPKECKTVLDEPAASAPAGGC